ncbi:ankyrin [Mollisia scopiformis]|uniref:Ankyrin n=1 Tax=Mollisia scopiformis TaxID=149040 RepID=A0A194XHY4_MOLSC|nr:ankyrin [Mollisia scopiformis]KUJ19746.1 ankyrin [Mollisia scopiformis]
MASPASTCTLAAESIDGDAPTDIDEEAEHDDFNQADDDTARFLNSIEESTTDDELVLADIYTHPGDQETLSPLMLAAVNPDPRILKATLQEGSLFYTAKSPADIERRQRLRIPLSPRPTSEFWPICFRSSQSEIGITTPLQEAIRAGLPENVDILLDAEANPNGPPTWVMENYSAFFLRFRPIVPSFPDLCGDVASRKALLERMDLPQLSTLTWEEVEDRFWDGMAPFWCEQDFVPADFYPHGEAIPAIVEAARCGSIEILDELLDAGADTSFWMTPQFFVPAYPTPSSLSVSSPIHAALQARDLDMLDHLLALGFEPNTMPLSNPTRCVTPLMAVITQHEEFDYVVWETLARRPNINFELRTPVYGVHLLHFAVATLNLNMLEHIIDYTPLKNAGVTALGHTLLHIACMPENAMEVQRHSQVVHYSIHETRDLHARNDPHAHRPPKGRHHEYKKTDPQAQMDVVRFLWERGIVDVQKTDVHGNTALHYLCGFRDPNQALLNWWLEQPGVRTVFATKRNMYNSTPQDLLRESELAQEAELSGWKPWWERMRKEERVAQKQAIWRGLLGDEAKREL